jgi:hypothetical protein
MMSNLILKSSPRFAKIIMYSGLHKSAYDAVSLTNISPTIPVN